MIAGVIIFLTFIIAMWVRGIIVDLKVETYMIANRDRWVPSGELGQKYGQAFAYPSLGKLELNGILEHREVPTPKDGPRGGRPRFEYRYVDRDTRRGRPLN